MFEKFECDRITVPSCDKHNSNKNIGDRAIVTAMLMGAYKVRMDYPGSPMLTSNILKAIDEAIPDFPQAKKEVQLRSFIIDSPKGIDFNLPYIEPQTKIYSWMRKLAAGLIWSVSGKHDFYFDWDKTLVWSPGYHPISGPIPREEATQRIFQNRNFESKLNTLDWHLGWTAKPREYPRDIYAFDFCFLDYPEEWDGMNIIFKHHFYNDISVWYTCFMVSPEAKERIAEFVGSQI